MSTPASGPAKSDNNFAGERVLTEFWPSAREDGRAMKLATSLPKALGFLIYAPLYILRAIDIFGIIRYTLTDQRIRVDRGMRREVIQSIPLDDIEDIRLVDHSPFTRTGTLEVVCKGAVQLKMVAISDPEPALRTIQKAVQSRISTQKVLRQQREAKEAVTV